MHIEDARAADFEVAFSIIERLWDYNSYDQEEVRAIYERVLEDENSFAFFIKDEAGAVKGFCHGAFFDTFWLSGQTCYVSSLFVEEDARRMGLGTRLLDHARSLAQARGCKGLVLDSGLARTGAHAFYEAYGFDKSCYGFDYYL